MTKQFMTRDTVPAVELVAVCNDPRHETPCPHYSDRPCVACQQECDPALLQTAEGEDLADKSVPSDQLYGQRMDSSDLGEN